MNDRELNRIAFEVENNLEENFQYMPTENYGKPVYKRYGAVNALEAEFEEEFENLEEHFKKGKLKNLGKKIGDKIKKVADQVKPEDAVFLPLVPFKGLLKKRLKKKGITPKSNKLKDIASAFHDAEVKVNFEASGNFVGDSIDLVKDILDLIKRVSDRVKAGKGSADDAEFSSDADKAANNADDLSERTLREELVTDDVIIAPSTPAATGGGMLSTNTILILVAAAAAVYFFSRKS
jgi:hypothetical protein